jgi:hypothetical protein
MSNKFVADGYQRFLCGRKAVTSESIEKKYAGALAKASPAGKIQVCKRIVEEYTRLLRTKNHKPSAGTLW